MEIKEIKLKKGEISEDAELRKKSAKEIEERIRATLEGRSIEGEKNDDKDIGMVVMIDGQKKGQGESVIEQLGVMTRARYNNGISYVSGMHFVYDDPHYRDRYDYQHKAMFKEYYQCDSTQKRLIEERNMKLDEIKEKSEGKKGKKYKKTIIIEIPIYNGTKSFKNPDLAPNPSQIKPNGFVRVETTKLELAQAGLLAEDFRIIKRGKEGKITLASMKKAIKASREASKEEFKKNIMEHDDEYEIL